MKMKMIVAALALAAAGSANAAIENGTSGNGEMFMTVWDQTGLQSYTLDLNLTMDDFIAGVAANQSFTFNADANMTTFLGQVLPANQSNLVYAIGAMDIKGANASDYHRYLTTSSNIVLGASTANQVRNVDLKQLGTQGGVMLGNANGLLGSNDSLIVTDPAILAYAGSASWGNNWGTKANFNTLGEIGDDLGMYFLRQTSGASAANNTRSIYEQMNWGNGDQVFANLSTNGTLTFAAAAPVPEADTYALMLAGLGLVGFLARRRKAA